MTCFFSLKISLENRLLRVHFSVNPGPRAGGRSLINPCFKVNQTRIRAVRIRVLTRTLRSVSKQRIRIHRRVLTLLDEQSKEPSVGLTLPLDLLRTCRAHCLSGKLPKPIEKACGACVCYCTMMPVFKSSPSTPLESKLRPHNEPPFFSR